MTLRSVPARVLACLIEKETTVPDSYPLTMKALLSACNQSSNRNPQTAYDERTVSEALDVLKADGLVRFVHPSHGGRTLRYRQVADERWELGRGALGVLAMLILRGAETEATLRARAERHLAESGATIEGALATLSEGDEPFVRRLERRAGEREPRYTQLVAESPDVESPVAAEDDAVTRADPQPSPSQPIDTRSAEPADRAEPVDETAELVEALIDEVTDLRRRIERLERLFDG